MTPEQALNYLDTLLGNVTLVAAPNGPSGLTRGDRVQIQTAVNVLRAAIAPPA